MKRWMKYVKPYWPYFILGPLCMIVEVIGEVLMPKYLSQIINNAASHTPWYSVGVAGMMILTAVLMMAGGVGGAYFGAKASVNFGIDIGYKISERFAFKSRTQIYRHIYFNRLSL